MLLFEFLQALLTEGRVRVDPCLDQSGRPRDLTAEAADAEFVLRQFEAEARLELAGDPPELESKSLVWAAVQVSRACSVLAFRDVSAEAVATLLSDPCPVPISNSVTYSVDLTFRFLPDLVRIAQAASSEDPATVSLRRLASEWPLSSVGISGIELNQPPTFLDHPCLRQLYVDRILARRDGTRLRDPVTRDAVRTALGRHVDLVPEFVPLLSDHSSEPVSQGSA